jgi:hypothetical protein
MEELNELYIPKSQLNKSESQIKGTIFFNFEPFDEVKPMCKSCPLR